MCFSKFLATATLSLVLTHIPSIIWAEETPLDPNVTPPEQAPTGEAKYSGPPIINFYLTDEDNLIIKVDGLLLKDVDGFSWGGFDISGMMESLEQQKLIKMTAREDGFQMDVNVPVQQLVASPTVFGVLYANKNTLSATIDSEKLLADRPKIEGRGFGWTNLYGTLTERSGCCYCGRCGTTYSSYATLYFYAWRGYWAYIGSTTATASGYFDISYQGQNEPYIKIVASHNGKTATATASGPSCPCSNSYVKANLYLQ
jgi:hypothetical protein